MAGEWQCLLARCTATTAFIRITTEMTPCDGVTKLVRGRAFFYKNSEESIARQLSATFTQLKCWPQIWEAQPCHVYCNAYAKQESAGTAHACSWRHCRWAAKPSCCSLVMASVSRPAFCVPSTPGKHLGHCTMCSRDRLTSTFCVQVYRQVKTDKCAKVTQQTQCLSFLEYKKNKIQQLSLLGYGNTTCFCLFFFAFFPPAFFFILKVVWICTRYGVEKKCRTEKKNADEGTG